MNIESFSRQALAVMICFLIISVLAATIFYLIQPVSLILSLAVWAIYTELLLVVYFLVRFATRTHAGVLSSFAIIACFSGGIPEYIILGISGGCLPWLLAVVTRSIP